MCYLVRQHPSELAAPDSVSPPPLQSVRPRWAGAAAATLVAGIALAAAVAVPRPAGPERLDVVRDSGAPAPVAARSTQIPATGGIEQTSLPMDDGVPAPAETSRAGLGHCHHGF